MTMAGRLILLLLAWTALTAQREPVLVPAVSQSRIEVRQGFTGARLLLVLNPVSRPLVEPEDSALPPPRHLP
jgi:hypothetical protein